MSIRLGRSAARWLALLALGACTTRGCDTQDAPRGEVRAFRCGADAAPDPRDERDARTLTAIDHALTFLEHTREPYAQLMLDVMRRRFRVARFDATVARYDESLVEPSPHAPGLRIFRRILDHDNQPQPGDAAALTPQVDRLTVPALYCDRTPLPSDYASLLEQANAAGGYLRTHALLALQWLRENGCASPAPPGYEAALLDGVAQLVTGDGAASDLQLEAAGLLYAYGRGDLVEPAFIDRAVAQQNPDGGWLVSFDEAGRSDWHGTVAGLYLLLHAYCGKRDYPPMLAP